MLVPFYLNISQTDGNVEPSSSVDERNTTDGDEDDKSQNNVGDMKKKEVFGRFSQRNYRRRTESESSTSSASMIDEAPQEQNNDNNGINSNLIEREVNNEKNNKQ